MSHIQSSHPPVAHVLNGRCSESKSEVGPKKKFAQPCPCIERGKGPGDTWQVWFSYMCWVSILCKRLYTFPFMGFHFLYGCLMRPSYWPKLSRICSVHSLATSSTNTADIYWGSLWWQFVAALGYIDSAQAAPAPKSEWHACYAGVRNITNVPTCRDSRMTNGRKTRYRDDSFPTLFSYLLLFRYSYMLLHFNVLYSRSCSIITPSSSEPSPPLSPSSLSPLPFLPLSPPLPPSLPSPSSLSPLPPLPLPLLPPSLPSLPLFPSIDPTELLTYRCMDIFNTGLLCWKAYLYHTLKVEHKDKCQLNSSKFTENWVYLCNNYISLLSH